MPKPTKVCSFDGCGLKHMAHDLCSGHYQQLKRGEQLRPLGNRSTTAGMGPVERLEHYTDRSGDCHLWTGSTNHLGYGSLTVNGRLRKAHRFAFELVHGPVDRSLDIDHMCYTPACVNVEHLRAIGRKQNIENRAGQSKANRSGYRNVHYFKRDRNWQAQVTHNGKKYHLGYFDDAEEAGAVALAKRMELFTHSDGR